MYTACMLMKVLKPIDIIVKHISALEVVNSVEEDIESERETVTNEKTKKMVDDFLEDVRVTISCTF